MRLSVILILLQLLLATGCRQSGAQAAADTSGQAVALPALIPYRDKEAWGFSDSAGNMIIPARFSEAKVLSPFLFYGRDKGPGQKTYLYNNHRKLLAVYDNKADDFILGRPDAPADSALKLFLFSRQHSDTLSIRGHVHTRSFPHHYIYDQSGGFPFDTVGYEKIIERTGRYLIIGKRAPQGMRWGLIDSTGRLAEPVAFAGIFPYTDNYLRVKDSANALYGGYPGERYYKWPFKNIDTIRREQQIAEGYFVLNYKTSSTKSLFRYDGKIIANAGGNGDFRMPGGIAETFRRGVPKYFMLVKSYPGKDGATLIDSNGTAMNTSDYRDFFRVTESLFLVNTNNESQSDYNAVFDVTTRRFLIDTAAGFRVRTFGKSWVSLSKDAKDVLVLNLKTRRQIPAGSIQLIWTAKGTYVRDAATGLLSDPDNAARQPVPVQYHGYEPMLRTGSGTHQGAFDPAAWKQIVPEEYDSIQFDVRSSDQPAHMPLVIARKDMQTSIYTISGRMIFRHQSRKIKVVANRKPYVIIEAGDSAVIADTGGHIIGTVPAGGTYNFTGSGCVLVAYNDHSLAVCPGRPVIDIPGTFDLKYKVVSARVPFIGITRNGKRALISTTDFRLATPYDLPAEKYELYYRGPKGLFEVYEEYERNRWRLKGYTNSRGMKYWKD